MVLILLCLLAACGKPHTHQCGDWQTITEANCVTKGKRCSVCDEVLVAQTEVPATGHHYLDGVCERCGQEKVSEGLAFTLNSDGESDSVTGIGSCTDTDIVISETYNDKPVTSIGDWAFYHCSSLTSITFNGTKQQWNAISKGYRWNDNTGAYTIHCTDGDVPKE